jgi:hypothetical protein
MLSVVCVLSIHHIKEGVGMAKNKYKIVSDELEATLTETMYEVEMTELKHWNEPIVLALMQVKRAKISLARGRAILDYSINKGK